MKLIKAIVVANLLLFAFQNSVMAQCVANAVITRSDSCSSVSFNSPNGDSLYLWIFGDGSPNSTAQNISHTYAPGTWTGTLTITCKNLTVSIDTFTINVLAPPSATFVLDKSEVCSNGGIACSIIDSPCVVGFIYIWTSSFGGLSTDCDTFCNTYTGDGNDTIVLKVKDPATNCTGSFQRIVTISDPPDAKFTIDSSAKCVPATVVVTNTTSPTGITGWEWIWGDGNFDFVQNPVSHTYTTAATYSIRLVAFSAGCSDTSIGVTFTAKPVPTSTFTISPSTPPTGVCAYDTATITYTGNGTTAATYVWTFDGATIISGGPNPGKLDTLLKWANGGNPFKTITLSVTENGCSSSFKDSVRVFQVDTLVLDSDDDNDTICSGDMICYDAEPLGMGTYQFFIDGVLKLSSPQYFFCTDTFTKNHTISVVGIDGNGCTTFSGNTKTIVINTKPVITSLTDSDSDNDICDGDSVRFTANPSGFNNYQFFVNFQRVKNSASRIYDTDSLENGDIVCVVPTSLGCVGDTFCSAPFTVTDHILAPTAYCGTTTISTIQFVWDPVTSVPIDSYQVSTDGSSYGAASGPGLTHTIGGLVASSSHTFIVRAIGPSPCNDTTYSDTITCVAVPCSAKNFGQIPDPPTVSICEGESTTLIITVSGTFPSTYNVSWDNGVSFGIDTTFTIAPLSDTTIPVIVRDLAQPPPTCTDVTKYFYITVTPVPVPSITNTDDNDTICFGECITFNTTLTNYDNYRFYEGSTTYQNGTNPNFQKCNFTAGVHTISVEATDNGCVDSATASPIRVLPLPTASITSVLANDTFCIGTTITINATAGMDDYTFLVNNIPRQNQPTNSWVYGGFSLTDINVSVIVIDSFGCMSDTSTLKTIKVNPLPTITGINFSPNDTIKKCDTIKLIATPGNMVTYEWFVNGSSFFTINNDTFITNGLQGGMNIIRVTGTDANGCTSPLSADQDTVWVIDKPSTLTISDADTTICLGDTVTFTLTSPINLDRYDFYVGTTVKQTGKSRIFGTTALQNGDTVTALAVDSAGAITCATDFSNAFIMKVRTPPTASIIDSTITPNDTICIGDTFKINGSVTVGAFVWSDGSSTGSFITPTNDTTDYFVPVAGRDTIILTSTNAPCPSAADTLLLRVLGMPVANAGTPQSLCQGVPFTINGSAQNGNIVWTTTSSGGTFNNATATPQYTPDASDIGLDTLTMTVSNGFCPDSVSEVSVNVKATPTAHAMLEICAGDSALLVVDSNIVKIAGTTYSWSPGGQTTTEITIPAENGTYILTVIRNGCSKDTVINFDVAECDPELPDEIPQIITVNGDGKNDFWFLTGIDYFPKNKVLIFNRWGQIVYRKDKYHNDWDGKNDNGVDLPTGTYYYVVDLFGDGVKLYKGFVMIQR